MVTYNLWRRLSPCVLSFEWKQGMLSPQFTFLVSSWRDSNIKKYCEDGSWYSTVQGLWLHFKRSWFFHLLIWVLAWARGLAVSPRKLLPHSKLCPAQQHQTRKQGMADLNFVISPCKKKLDPLWTVYPQVNWVPRLFETKCSLLHRQARKKETTQMSIKHWNVSAAGGRLFFNLSVHITLGWNHTRLQGQGWPVV